MKAEVKVKEAMTRKVETVTPEMPVIEAAKKMADEKIGSVVVVDDKGMPIGIVTERDVLYNVVAKNRIASEIKVKEIMSSPIRYVSPETNIIEASKIMAKYNIRRLPVIKEGKLVGIITNKDIIAISPSTIEILKELCEINARDVQQSSPQEVPEVGTCEICGDYMVRLYEVEGKFVCEKCKEDMLGEE